MLTVKSLSFDSKQFLLPRAIYSTLSRTISACYGIRPQLHISDSSQSCTSRVLVLHRRLQLSCSRKVCMQGLCLVSMIIIATCTPISLHDRRHKIPWIQNPHFDQAHSLLGIRLSISQNLGVLSIACDGLVVIRKTYSEQI